MNRRTKWSQRILALAMAAVMCCTYIPVGAFAEMPPLQESTVATEEPQTDETETDSGQTDASSPDPGAATAESAAPTTDEPPEENEPYTFAGEVLYQDMPDAPTGSYIGSYGLPVATGETKIGLGAWDTDLEQTNYLSAESLNSDNLMLAAPLLEDTDYAIVPILAQVEYPTDGSTVDLVLPDSVTLLDYYGEPAKDAESLLHSEYSETSAAVLGVYVQADADFAAQLVYTAPDGSALTKTLNVAIDRNATAEYPFPDSEIATFAERPTPAVTSGKITKVAKVNGTWLIWFNGEPAYCCTHGANGQPAGCPTYTYVNTSTVGADQCVPGDHYYVNEDPMEVTFTYDGQAVQVLESTCTDKPTEMWVSKRDLTNDEELPGATLCMKDSDGNVVESWVSTDTPHRVTGLHLGDAYTLTETRPADGYALADEITFRLLQKADEGGNNLQEAEVYYLTTKNFLFWTWDDWKLLDDATVIMRDDTIKVEISKKDLTTMEELPGADLTITDKDGKEIDRWVSTDTPHYIEKLPAGDYTLTEVKAPDGYAFAESVPFTVLPTGEVQRFEMRDDVIKVEISKKDLTTMEELPGAELTITDKDGKEIDRWVSTDKPHYIEKLPAGDYTLTEVKAPDGYAFAEIVPFTVLPTGEVQRFEMRDDVIKLEISKVDITTNKELPGAELIITNKDGKVVEHWTSTDKPHYIEKLPAGDYTLTEVTAPNGYEIAEDISFTVLPSGEVQRVVMKDAPIPKQPAQPTPPSTPTPTPLIPQTGDTFPLGLILALAGLSLAGLAALICKCVHCKSVAEHDETEDGEH